VLGPAMRADLIPKIMEAGMMGVIRVT